MANLGGRCPLDPIKNRKEQENFMKKELEKYYKKPFDTLEIELGITDYQALSEKYCAGPCSNLLC